VVFSQAQYLQRGRAKGLPPKRARPFPRSGAGFLLGPQAIFIQKTGWLPGDFSASWGYGWGRNAPL